MTPHEQVTGVTMKLDPITIPFVTGTALAADGGGVLV